jgi:hypothetical protein
MWTITMVTMAYFIVHEVNHGMMRTNSTVTLRGKFPCSEQLCKLAWLHVSKHRGDSEVCEEMALCHRLGFVDRAI